MIYDEFSGSQEIQDGLEILRVAVDEIGAPGVPVAGDHAAVLARKHPGLEKVVGKSGNGPNNEAPSDVNKSFDGCTNLG